MDYTCLGGRELWHASTTHEGDVIGVIEHLDQANAAGEICNQRQVSKSCYRRHHPIYKPLLRTTCARSEWTTILVISHCEDVAGSAWGARASTYGGNHPPGQCRNGSHSRQSSPTRPVSPWAARSLVEYPWLRAVVTTTWWSGVRSVAICCRWLLANRGGLPINKELWQTKRAAYLVFIIYKSHGARQ